MNGNTDQSNVTFIGPVGAIQRVLKVTGKDLKDVDLIEVNIT